MFDTGITALFDAHMALQQLIDEADASPGHLSDEAMNQLTSQQSEIELAIAETP